MKFHRIKAITVQNLFHMKHSFEDFVNAFWWPVLDLLIWGLMTRYFYQLKGISGNIIAFLMSGMILWHIVWRAQEDISVTFLRNVWSKNLLNLFVSPLTIWEFLAGTLLLGAIKIVFTLLAVTAVAFFAYSFNLFILGWSLIPFFASLLISGWIAGLFITGFIVRYGLRIQAFSWSLIGLIHPFSCVLYPFDSLPLWMQKIAWFLPTTHVFEGMRGVLAGAGFSIEHILWAFGLNILYLVLSGLFFSFMFEKARETGRLVKLEE